MRIRKFQASDNVRLLFFLRFFSRLIPAYVIERLYWEQRGMSIQEVVYTEIIYAVTIVLGHAEKTRFRNML